MALQLSNVGATRYYGKIEFGSPYRVYKVEFSLSRANLFISDHDFDVLKSTTCTVTSSHYAFVDNKKLVHATRAQDRLKLLEKDFQVDFALLKDGNGVIPSHLAGVFGLDLRPSNTGYPESTLEMLLESYSDKVVSLYLTPDPGKKGSFLAVGRDALERANLLGAPGNTVQWAEVSGGNSRWQVAVEGFGMLHSGSFSPDYCAMSQSRCVAVFDSSEPTLRIPRAFYNSFIRSLVLQANANCYYDGNGGDLLCSKCTAEDWHPIGFRIGTVADEGSSTPRHRIYQLQPSDYLVDVGDYRCRVLISETLFDSDNTFYLGNAFLKTHHTLYDAESKRVGLVCLDYEDSCVGGIGHFEEATVTTYCLLETEDHGDICFESPVVYYIFWGIGITFLLIFFGTLGHLAFVKSLRLYNRCRTRKTQLVQCAPVPETLGQRLLDGMDDEADAQDEEDEGVGIALT